MPGSPEELRPREIVVNDRMQSGYRYLLTEPQGANFAPGFEPELSPAQMLALGVFCGKYLAGLRRLYHRRALLLCGQSAALSEQHHWTTLLSELRQRYFLLVAKQQTRSDLLI